MTNNPLLSVIIPVYNKAEYLSETLNSVLKSDYKNFEIIVVNDGSPDNTDEVIKPYLKNDQIKYIKQDNAGVCVARNNGIENARGKYILPLDADDLISVDYLKKCIECLEENPHIGLVYSKSKTFKKSIRKSSEWYLGEYEFTKQLGMSFIYNAGVFYKSDWEKIGGYDVNMKWGLEDWEFWIHLISKMNKSVVRLDFFGFYYRGYSNNSRTGNLGKSNKQEELKSYIYNKHKELYKAHYGDLSMQVISEMAYYKYKVDRLEHYLKKITPSGLKQLTSELIKKIL